MRVGREQAARLRHAPAAELAVVAEHGAELAPAEVVPRAAQRDRGARAGEEREVGGDRAAAEVRVVAEQRVPAIPGVWQPGARKGSILSWALAEAAGRSRLPATEGVLWDQKGQAGPVQPPDRLMGRGLEQRPRVDQLGGSAASSASTPLSSPPKTPPPPSTTSPRMYCPDARDPDA